jgi:mercuric ion transport protein
MPRVELIYDPDCPNVDVARGQLLRAFGELGLNPHWQEWCSDDPAMPEHARGYASPTILVDGRDVNNAEPIDGTASCRIYATSGGIAGAPSVREITTTLEAGGGLALLTPPGTGKGQWQSSVAMLPAVGMSLLPKLACPACWPAYAGLMGSMGLGFLIDTTYLLPLTGVFLAAAVGALAFRARLRRGYGPFALGLLAAFAVLIGKFAFDNDAAMYAGVALLIGASLWNGWPKQQHAASCPACAEHPAPSQS